MHTLGHQVRSQVLLQSSPRSPRLPWPGPTLPSTCPELREALPDARTHLHIGVERYVGTLRSTRTFLRDSDTKHRHTPMWRYPPPPCMHTLTGTYRLDAGIQSGGDTPLPPAPGLLERGHPWATTGLMRGPNGLGTLVPACLPACGLRAAASWALGLAWLPGGGSVGLVWFTLGSQESPPLPYSSGSEQAQAGSGVRRLGLSLGLTLQQRFLPQLPEAAWEKRPAGPPR